MEHSQEKQEKSSAKESNGRITKSSVSSLQELFNSMRLHAEEQRGYFFRSDDDADDFLASE